MNILRNKNIKLAIFDMAGTTVQENGIIYDVLYYTLNSFNLNGGSLDATDVSIIQGTASDIESLYILPAVVGLGNEDITLFYSFPTAALLKRIDNYTSGTIDAQLLTSIKGKASDLITIYASSGIVGLGNEDINITSGTASTSEANTLIALTT